MSSKGKCRNSSPAFEEVLDRFVARRTFLRSSALLGAAITLPACGTREDSAKTVPNPDASAGSVTPGTLSFKELEHGLDETLAVADAYETQVLIRWGDPVFDGLATFDPHQLDADEQRQRFGFNNDFIGFVSLPAGSNRSDHGLLVVNHEYVNSKLMHPGSPLGWDLSEAQVEKEIAAHGLSVIEIKREGDAWKVITDSRFNRRIHPETPMAITGPAKGSERLKTAISKDGVHTLGTYGNCAGGVTPWGTILTGEENVDGYFMGNVDSSPEAENYHRFDVTTYKNWGQHKARWNIEKSPNELLHVGWVVEIDPYDPESVPKKRSSLGRMKHEGCNVYINSDRRVVAYTGDDERFEYIYKFVSEHEYDPGNRQANLDLLDKGTLYVARFDDNGELHWLSLVYGEGPLTEANGFFSQADVSLDTRKAADLVGATPMDRPEDVEVNPHNGHVYAMLTNNSERKSEQVDLANPRAHNNHGQILEFWPETGDHSAEMFQWDLFLLAGDPAKVATKYHAGISPSGWLSCPDNCAFDRLGNLWIATDGAEKSGVADGLWATEVSGEAKTLTKRFLRTPRGAELCGPFFTPDSENLFVSIQHPGDAGSFDKPDTHWPDFSDDMPARPAVVVITKKGGGRIGS